MSVFSAAQLQVANEKLREERRRQEEALAVVRDEIRDLRRELHPQRRTVNALSLSLCSRVIFAHPR